MEDIVRPSNLLYLDLLESSTGTNLYLGKGYMKGHDTDNNDNYWCSYIESLEHKRDGENPW